MPANTDSNGRFQWPENGWSTGKMRKRGQNAEGQQLAADWTRRGTPEFGTPEADRAAGMGLSARGGASKAQTGVSGITQDIAEHKQIIQDGVNDLAQGNLTPKGLQQILKRLGWRSGKNGSFLDPTGDEHQILPVQAETQTQPEFKE
jgi:hypothetical protein